MKAKRKKVDFTSVVCIVKRNKRYLFCKREDNGLWTLPGGRIEKGENFQKAALRELFEETGLQAKNIKLRASWLIKKGLKSEKTAVFEVKSTGGKITPSWESPEVIFMDSADIVERVPLYTRELLNEIDNQKDFFKLEAKRYEYWVILRYVYGVLKRKLRDLKI